MTPGLSPDLQEISDVRKTAVINSELLRLKVDIAALQETRLAELGTLRESDYTFIWKGKGADEVREHGVGFAIKNSLMQMVEPGEDGTERIYTLRLHTTDGPVTFVSAYAPTLYSSPDIKEEFYDQLQTVIRCVPSREPLILLGDFNARVGADHGSWSSCLGPFGIGLINDNGQRLLELCTLHSLCVTNTFFQTRPQHKVSWCHPRSKRWHQLDLVLTRRCHLQNVLITRSYHSADCDTDHSLVISKLRLCPKKLHQSKPPGKPRINTSRMSQQLSEEFRQSSQSPSTPNHRTVTPTRDGVFFARPFTTLPSPSLANKRGSLLTGSRPIPTYLFPSQKEGGRPP